MTPTRELAARTTIAAQVTAALREDILVGRIQPGERVRIQSVAEDFGVSPIPVREALTALQAEGFLHVEGNSRGMIASSVSVEDLGSLYDMRCLIECSLSREAAAMLDDANLKEIRSNFEAMNRALAAMVPASAEDKPDRQMPHEYWGVHRGFHRAMLAPKLEGWTQTVLDQLWNASERYVRLYGAGFGSVSEATEDHLALIEACEEHDGEALAAITERHLRRTEGAVRRGFAKLRDA